MLDDVRAWRRGKEEARCFCEDLQDAAVAQVEPGVCVQQTKFWLPVQPHQVIDVGGGYVGERLMLAGACRDDVSSVVGAYRIESQTEKLNATGGASHAHSLLRLG